MVFKGYCFFSPPCHEQEREPENLAGERGRLHLGQQLGRNITWWMPVLKRWQERNQPAWLLWSMRLRPGREPSWGLSRDTGRKATDTSQQVSAAPRSSVGLSSSGPGETRVTPATGQPIAQVLDHTDGPLSPSFSNPAAPQAGASQSLVRSTP